MHPLSMTTENYRKAFEIATKTAVEEVQTGFIGSEHLLYAFLHIPECEAYKILLSVGVSKEKYQAIFRERVDRTFEGNGLTVRTKKMYDAAVYMAEEDGATNSELEGTYFKVTQGRNLYPGLLIREIKF